MRKMAWWMLFLMVVGFAITLAPQPAAAQGEGGQYVSVAGLQDWTPETNYMSLAGYLRWMTFTEQKVWLSVAEAKRIVAEQMAG